MHAPPSAHGRPVAWIVPSELVPSAIRAKVTTSMHIYSL